LNTAILASHGTDNKAGAASIAELVRAVANASTELEVLEAFVDVQSPDVPTVLGGVLESNSGATVAIAPLLLATGYHVRKDIADAATEALAEHSSAQISIVPALGPDARLVEVLVQRLGEVGYQQGDIVILAVAGSSDARAQGESRLVQLMLEEQLGHSVELAFLSAAEPKLKDLVPKLKFQNPRKRVVVATYLLADGYFASVTKKSGAHLVSEPLLATDHPVPAQLIEVVRDRVAGPTTGCLTSADFAAGKPWSCAAGCSSPCRQES
jgi:sirohydrochlorin ferrochelatase